jgi:hypothetical protein
MNSTSGLTTLIVCALFCGLVGYLLVSKNPPKRVEIPEDMTPVVMDDTVWEQPSDGSILPGPPDEQEVRAPGKIDEDAPKDFIETKLGLKYRILRKSDGKRPNITNLVRVDYKGWLNNGFIFDSSYHEEDPAEFLLGDLVVGWQEGIALLGVGGMIELEVPPHLGYGSKPSGRIPPNSTLHFIVELHDIPKERSPPKMPKKKTGNP